MIEYKNTVKSDVDVVKRPETMDSCESWQINTVPNGLCWHESTLHFLRDLSNYFLKSSACREYDELVALGFWLRNSNIERYKAMIGDEVRKPLGLVVHYAPNNVDTLFVYSWICSLLMGNRNIIRLGSRESVMQSLAIEGIHSTLQLPEYREISLRNRFLRFPKQADINKAVSQMADARVIWGSDESVLAVKALPAKVRCRDITFNDRYSVAVIDLSRSDSNKLEDIADRLWGALFPFAQQACSSPRVLFGIGKPSDFNEIFERLGVQSIGQAASSLSATEQLVYGQLISAQGNVEQIEYYGRLVVIRGKSEKSISVSRHPGHQTLVFYACQTLPEIRALLTDNVQTLAYFGVERDALLKFILEPSIQGVDRVVPLEQALQFSPRWDGYNLLAELSRTVDFI